jgi:hypothetical protein
MIRRIGKSILPYLPDSLKRLIYHAYENHYAKICQRRVGPLPKIRKVSKLSGKKNVLFYHISGLSFGGTEKYLQILAKYIDKNKYEVFYLHSPRPRALSGYINLKERAPYLENAGVKLIEFDYEEMETAYPYFIKGMKPSIFEVIAEKNIELLVTATPGYTEYPINIINNLPIILINIFGSINTQKNIVKDICISKTLARRIEGVVPRNKIEVMYTPIERPKEEYKNLGQELRQSLGFQEKDIIFGRIGRPVDDIFDPIGIRAFQKIVTKYPEAKYLIQSPPPILRKIVQEESIPNVYFLEPTSAEERIWAFHFAIDAAAHWRYDGESCGMNIIESMVAEKPIISHRSHVWNAHLEYLEPSFARVADKDNVEEYAKYMEEFILLKKAGRLEALGKAAGKRAEQFLIENNIGRFENWVEEAIKNHD